MNNFFRYFAALVCAIYLANPGFGIFEILPDTLPFVGNLDEGAAGAALLYLLQSFRKKREAAASQGDVDQESG